MTDSISRKAGGLFESVRRLVQSLKEDGVDVCVLGTADEFTHKDIGLWNPVEAQAFSPKWPRKFGYTREFQRALQQYAPDLTHTHGIWLYPSVATNHFSRRRGLPYLISPHGMLDPWAVRRSHWKKVLAYILYEGSHLREANCIRALCEREARAIRQVGLKNPIAIIPNGIDLVEMRSAEESRKQKAESRNPPWEGTMEPGRKVLLYLGRIHPKKGLTNLLRAWKEVNDRWPVVSGRGGEWVLAIAGWDQGGHEGELKRLATELGLSWTDVRATGLRDHKSGAPVVSGQWSVVFLGPQFNEAKAACYAQCDGFILPSFSEGLPMVVLEAWVHGKPVLMTPECNFPEAFARGAALRIETTSDSMVAGLRDFFTATDSSHREMGRAGLELVRERFVWSDIAHQMHQLYSWMLGGGAQPSCLADF